MKTNRNKAVSLVSSVVLCGVLVWCGQRNAFSAFGLGDNGARTRPAATAPAPAPHKPKYVRGIHMTAWVTGSAKMRKTYDQLFNETELNTAVIDIKEYEGEIYLPGFKPAEEYKTYTPAIPDLQKYLANLRSRGIYTVARIVVFKDNKLPRRRPELGVKNSAGELWRDRKGITWCDPYNKEVWNYNLSLAEKAAEMGFEEIQFDYIRFPSDGNLSNLRYCQVHNSTTSAQALVDFLKEAHRRLKPKGVNISIDVFGLTTTVKHDMGIGQKMEEMTRWVDFVSPMTYPSHYAKGEYGIPDPNKAPYKTLYLAMVGAKKKLGTIAKIRPFLQDFSLGVHYGASEVRAQIQACYDNDVAEWLLWNPRCVYTRGGLMGKGAASAYEKKELPEFMKPKKPVEKVAAAADKARASAGTPAARPSQATVAPGPR